MSDFGGAAQELEEDMFAENDIGPSRSSNHDRHLTSSAGLDALTSAMDIGNARDALVKLQPNLNNGGTDGGGEAAGGGSDSGGGRFEHQRQRTELEVAMELYKAAERRQQARLLASFRSGDQPMPGDSNDDRKRASESASNEDQKKRGKKAIMSDEPEEEEDVCFICHVGGELVLCDRRTCRKAYHLSCIGRDVAFFKNEGACICGWHFCAVCTKAANFQCCTCPTAYCASCSAQADFHGIRESKGLCHGCREFVQMIENKGVGIGSTDRETDDFGLSLTPEELGKDDADAGKVPKESLSWSYIQRQQLEDPRRKTRIVCDDRIRTLFGKKTVGPSGLHQHLQPHFAPKGRGRAGRQIRDEEVGMEGDGTDPDYTAADERHNGINVKDGRGKKKTEEDRLERSNRNEYAAVTPKNIGLIYLRRRLLEELFDDPEFDSKVCGTFVRIRVAGMITNSEMCYRLVQVVGTRLQPEQYKAGRKVTNYVLEILNLQNRGTVSVDLVSNQEFSEEECERLRQSMKCGFIKALTVGDVEDKAKSLQEAKVNDWFETEKQRLVNLRGCADEKGRKKELRECLDKLVEMDSPAFRAAKLHARPEVTADPRMGPDYKSDDNDEKAKDGMSTVLDEVHLSSPGDKVPPAGIPKGHNESSRGWESTGSKQSSWEDTYRSKEGDTLYDSSRSSEKLSYGRPSHNYGLESAKERDYKERERGWGTGQHNSVAGEAGWMGNGRNRPTPAQKWKGKVDVSMNVDATSDYRGITGMTAPVFDTKADWQSRREAAPPGAPSLPQGVPVPSPNVSTQAAMEAAGKANIWHYTDRTGTTQGPFTMEQLREWNATGYFPGDLRIWRTNQPREESILLTDGLAGRLQKGRGSMTRVGNPVVASIQQEAGWTGNGRNRPTAAQKWNEEVDVSMNVDARSGRSDYRGITGMTAPVFDTKADWQSRREAAPPGAPSLPQGVPVPSPNVSTQAALEAAGKENIWHYTDPTGKTQGPFTMEQLRKWNATGYFPEDLRIWRTNQPQEESILLTDGLAGRLQKGREPRGSTTRVWDRVVASIQEEIAPNCSTVTLNDNPALKSADGRRGNGGASSSTDRGGSGDVGRSVSYGCQDVNPSKRISARDAGSGPSALLRGTNIDMKWKPGPAGDSYGRSIDNSFPTGIGRADAGAKCDPANWSGSTSGRPERDSWGSSPAPGSDSGRYSNLGGRGSLGRGSNYRDSGGKWNPDESGGIGSSRSSSREALRASRKEIICRFHAKGYCKRGDSCDYWHG